MIKIKKFFQLLFIKIETPKQYRTIKYCFNEYKKECEIKFTFYEYALFWANHKMDNKYLMKNRDGSTSECKIVYFPLHSTYDVKYDKQGELILKYNEEGKVIPPSQVYFKDLTALVEFPILEGYDLREMPVRFLKKI